MNDAPDLETRLKRLEDRFAIADLCAEYCAALDDRDLERFLTCFTDDAVIRHADGVMSLAGLPAIRDYYTQRFRDYGVTFHYPHAHTVIIEDADNAGGAVTAHAEMALDGEAWVAAFRYTDRYRREAARWRIAERVLACWYYMRLADLPGGLAGELRKHYRGERLPAELPESLESFQAWRM